MILRTLMFSMRDIRTLCRISTITIMLIHSMQDSMDQHKGPFSSHPSLSKVLSHKVLRCSRTHITSLSILMEDSKDCNNSQVVLSSHKVTFILRQARSIIRQELLFINSLKDSYLLISSLRCN